MTDAHPLRLDRSKYHASVHGEFQGRTRYWQDGLPFDALGELVAEECSAEQLAQADAKAPRPQPANPPRGGEGGGGVDHGRSDGGGDPATQEVAPALTQGEVNLELWAKGEARYLPAAVFKAVRERYNKSVSTFADAIEFLVNEAKLIPASEASQQLLGQGGIAPVKEEA
jgi:hypothetical protein